MRCAYRNRNNPNNRNDNNGFRVVSHGFHPMHDPCVGRNTAAATASAARNESRRSQLLSEPDPTGSGPDAYRRGLLPARIRSTAGLEQTQKPTFLGAIMALTGQQIKQLQQALLDGFPSKALLEMMVRIELNQQLDLIAEGENQK